MMAKLTYLGPLPADDPLYRMETFVVPVSKLGQDAQKPDPPAAENPLAPPPKTRRRHPGRSGSK